MSKLVLLVLAALAVFALAVMLVLAAMTPDTIDMHRAATPTAVQQAVASCRAESTLV